MTNLSVPSELVKSAGKAFIEFLNKSVTPYHAVNSCEKLLKEAGFNELFEQEDFEVLPGNKYFIKKNQATIFAFAVGKLYVPGNGFSIVAAHTDSPCLRVKPVSKRTSQNFLQVGVAAYGGGLFRTWFDRDLSVAGQVAFQRDDHIQHKLIDVQRPIFSIPSLAIHLDRKSAEAFEFNKETHLLPIMATVSPTLCANNKSDGKMDEENFNCSIANEHHDEFLKLVAEQAGCNVDELLDIDLYLYDTQKATLSGLHEEFISGARLDNLVGTYTAINGLIRSVQDADSLKNEPNIRIAVCYDHEEVGSESSSGAGSAFSEWLLRRLAVNLEKLDPTTFERAIAKSYLISADQAHGVHPNYQEKHEDKHRPSFHGGVVVKVNVNQRYATTGITHSILKVIAEKAGLPLQKVVVRNDSGCGSTVGPILSSLLAIQTIDVGCPQLAMHSIRELADVTSITQATNLYSKFFELLPSVLESVQIAK